MSSMTKLGAKCFPIPSGTMTRRPYWTPPGPGSANSGPTLISSTPAVRARVVGDHCRHLSHVRQHVERRLTGCGHLILPLCLSLSASTTDISPSKSVIPRAGIIRGRRRPSSVLRDVVRSSSWPRQARVGVMLVVARTRKLVLGRSYNDIAVTIVTSGLSCTCAQFAEDIRNVVNDLRPDGFCGSCRCQVLVVFKT